LGECQPSLDSAVSSLDFHDDESLDLDHSSDAVNRIERIGYRHARAGRFQMGRRFPALMASARLVPAWQDAEPAASSTDEGRGAAMGTKNPWGAPAKAEEWAKATINSVVKRTEKVELDRKSVCSNWRVTSRFDSSFCKRTPIVFRGDYDSLNKANRRWEKELKQHWVAGELAPPGARLEPHDVSEESVEAIAGARRRGRLQCRELHQAYKVKRGEFKERMVDQGYDESAFENYLQEKALAASKYDKKVPRKTVVSSRKGSAQGLMELFGKTRMLAGGTSFCAPA
jgi:hypothetical protein